MPAGNDAELLLHIVNFYKRLSAKADKKPKGNGIKDGCVRWGCVYAVVFLFFLSELCGGLPKLLLLNKKHVGKSCINSTGCGRV